MRARDVLVTLIEAYENQHYAFGPADPVEAIIFRMEQQGLTARATAIVVTGSGPGELRVIAEAIEVL